LPGLLLGRELVRESRKHRYFLYNGLFVACVVGVMTVKLYSDRGLDDLASEGRSLFRSCVLIQLVGILILSTLRAGGPAEERSLGSLHLLRITRLSEAGIVAGHFLSAVAKALATILLVSPILLLAGAVGGVGLAQTASLSVVALIAAALATALTVLLASVTKNATRAITWSIVVQLVFLLLSSEKTMVHITWWPHAYSLSELLLYDAAHAREPAIHFIASHLIATAVLLVGASVLLRASPGTGRKITVRSLVDFASNVLGRQRKSQEALPLAAPALSSNPPLWREAALKALRGPGLVRFVLTSAAVIGVFLLVAQTRPLRRGRGWVGLFFTWFPFALVFLGLVIPPASAFRTERLGRGLAILAVTPLAARDIVVCKFLSSIRTLLLPTIILVICLLSSAKDIHQIGGRHILSALAWFSLSLPVIAMILYVGARSQSIATAILAGLIIVFVTVTLFSGGHDHRSIVHAAHEAVKKCAAGGVAATVLAGILLVRRKRILTNAAVLAGFLSIPFAVAGLYGLTLGRALESVDPNGIFVELALIAGVLYLAGKVQGKQYAGHLALMGVLIGVLRVVSLRKIAPVDWTILIEIALIVLLGNAIRWTRSGSVNRTALVVGFVFSVTLLFYKRVPRSFEFGVARDIGVLPVLVVLLLGGLTTVLFLESAGRQFDLALGRHG